MTDPTAGGEAAASFRTAIVSGDPAEDLAGFEEYFAAGCRAGALAPLSREEREARVLPLAPERAEAVRDRLARLGYNPGRPADPDLSGLAAATAMFQREAGLPDHGVVDVATWDALQALFTFEKPLRLETWLDAAGAPQPALERAARLRLSVLGFGAPPESGAAEPSRRVRRHGPRPRFMASPRREAEDGSGLAAFESACTDLGLPGGADAELPARVARLFDHEAFLAALAGVDGGRLVTLSKPRREAAETLLICTAKIELWLFGYDVQPDGDPELGFRTRRGRPGAPPPMRRFNETRTAREMRTFLADIEPAVARLPLPQLPMELPLLFRQALVLRTRAPARTDHSEHSASAAIVDALMPEMEREPDLLARVFRRATALVGRLFDGIRRVIAWVGGLIRRAAQRVFEQALNLWRAVYHFSGHVAFRLRQAIDAFVGGARFLCSPLQESQPPGSAVYLRRSDFDVALVVDDGSDGTAVVRFARGLQRGARQFSIACRIVALAVRSVKAIAFRPGLGPLGYVSLVLGLGRIYTEVRLLGAALDALEVAA